MRLLRFALPVVLCTIIAGCGDKKSPSAPTPPQAAAGNLSISDLTVSAYGPPGDITYTLSMRITETTGQGAATVTSLTVAFDGARSVTVPIDNARFTAGTSQRLSDATFKDTSGQAIANRLTVSSGFRDDGGRTGTATATADVRKLALVTLSGILTNRVNGRPIPNGTIRVQSSGPNIGKITKTDINGFYALTPLVSGAFRVFYEASGHADQSHQIDIATDATWNVALDPNVEYRITGTARTCSVTYENELGGTSQSRVTIPWSYGRGASAGNFLYVSCQIDTGGDNGSIAVRIYRNGDLLTSGFANGFPNIATASGRF